MTTHAITDAEKAIAAPRRRPFRNGPVYRITGFRYLLFYPVCLLLRLYYRTIRFRITPEERALLEDESRPTLLVVWHNREFIIAEIFRRFRTTEKISCLVSPSKDAAWLVAFFSHYGLNSIRGSSSRRSIAATRELLKEHRRGQSLGITPDGPDGPLYEVKHGAAALARHTQAPILLISATFGSATRMKTWDGCYLAKPFSTVRIRCRRFESYEAIEAADDDEVALKLRDAFVEITEDTQPIPDA